MAEITFNPSNTYVKKLLTKTFDYPPKQIQSGKLEANTHPGIYHLAQLNGDFYLAPDEAKKYLEAEKKYKAFIAKTPTICNTNAFNQLIKASLSLTIGPAMANWNPIPDRNFIPTGCNYAQLRSYAAGIGVAHPDHPTLYQRMLFGVADLKGLGDAAWDKVAKSILQIRVNGVSYGTAFHIGQGYFLTARHVLFPNNSDIINEGNGKYHLREDPLGQCKTIKSIELIYIDPKGQPAFEIKIDSSQVTTLGNFQEYGDELAIIYAPEAVQAFADNFFHISSLALRSEPLKPGETVVLTGLPRFNDKSFYKVAELGVVGGISSDSNHTNVEVLISNTIMDKAMSGGACLDTSGRVIGIASAMDHRSKESICINLTAPGNFREPLKSTLETAISAQNPAP